MADKTPNELIDEMIEKMVREPRSLTPNDQAMLREAGILTPKVETLLREAGILTPAAGKTPNELMDEMKKIVDRTFRGEGATVTLTTGQPLSMEDLKVLGKSSLDPVPADAKPMTDEQADALEQRIINAQYEAISKEYGKDAADYANYGWAVEVGKYSVGVATKVYVDPVMIIDTEARPDTELTHNWAEY